ncbi:MAG: TonB-dependent receptor [Longimicrobiales bacterium]
MRTVTFSGTLLLALVSAASAQRSPEAIQGRVMSDGGGPVGAANVFLLETLEGALTDSTGRFAIRSAIAGEATLVIKARDFREWRLRVVLPSAQPVVAVLITELVRLAPIEVRAGSYIATDAPDVSLTSLQVVTTPGTQADVYRALQTFPGLQQVDEGAGLFVRGGDVGETRVFLDGALVLSPYRYESPTGGFFGAFDPFLLDGIFFSSGGFGARWGDALSGVASLQTRGRPDRLTGGFTASLAAFSGSVSAPLPRGLGVHATATRSHTRLLFDVNGSTSDFTRVPEGRDLSGSIVWKYGRDGEVRVFAIDQWNKLGVVVDEASYSGAFEADEEHDMVVASWRDRVGRIRTELAAATARAQRDQSFGVFALETSERVDQVRGLAAFEPAAGLMITLGGDLERRTARFAGSVPEEGYDIAPGARREVFSSSVDGDRQSVFIEGDAWLRGRLRLTAGLRSDHSTLTDRWTADPRLAAALRIAEGATLTAAWGRYHQVPTPFFYESAIGDTTLGPMRATHWILGGQFGEEGVLLRVEGYVKRYRELAQWTRSYDVARNGTGTSRGLDVFFRWPAFLGFTGRTAQSFIRARRTDPDEGVVTRSPFDISHVAATVLERRFGARWSAAAAYRTATGRPYTEVTGADYDAVQAVWVPRYGAPMAERMPEFRRLDLSASYLLTLFGADFTVLFVGVTNALDRENLYSYRYSADYSERIPVRSQFKRSIYFGASVTF